MCLGLVTEAIHVRRPFEGGKNREKRGMGRREKEKEKEREREERRERGERERERESQTVPYVLHKCSFKETQT